MASSLRILPATRLASAGVAGFFLLTACGLFPDGGGSRELSGNGYVHYHLYPDTGQCYCGTGYDFAAHGKMVAAISPSVHAHYGERLCEDRRYAHVTSVSTGKSVRVLIVDKGGTAGGDYARTDRHIMDLSREAFDSLDADGEGRKAGRIYVRWELAPAP